jgi:hypothetical protein
VMRERVEHLDDALILARLGGWFDDQGHESDKGPARPPAKAVSP